MDVKKASTSVFGTVALEGDEVDAGPVLTSGLGTCGTGGFSSAKHASDQCA